MFEDVPEHLREDVREILKLRERLEERWPEKDLLSFHGPASVYNYHPFLFREAFPGVSIEALRDLSLAAMLVSGAVVLRDQIMDRPTGTTRAALRCHAMEYEAHQIWNRHFTPASPFWRRYRKLAAAYTRMNLEVRSFAGGDWPWARFTDAFAKELAACNAGLACSTVDALAELSGRGEHHERLRSSIDRYNVARQLWDDACDWKEDLAGGGATLVIARVFVARPELATRTRDVALQKEFAREAHYGGHIRHLLELALEELGLAEELAAGLPCPLWSGVLAHLRRSCQELQADLAGIATRNVRRASASAQVSVRSAGSRDPFV